MSRDYVNGRYPFTGRYVMPDWMDTRPASAASIARETDDNPVMPEPRLTIEPTWLRSRRRTITLTINPERDIDIDYTHPHREPWMPNVPKRAPLKVYVMSEWQHYLEIRGPYHRDFIEEIKTLIPKNDRVWDNHYKCWRIHMNHREIIVNLCNKYNEAILGIPSTTKVKLELHNNDKEEDLTKKVVSILKVTPVF